MTSGECFENKWFYMKYIGKYLECGNTFDPWVVHNGLGYSGVMVRVLASNEGQTKDY